MSDDATVGPPMIAGFRYEAELGHGGFADVYRYEQESLGRSVAIKVLHGLSGAAASSFKAESLVMARLSNHPAVVSIYQVGTADDGRAYLVMQYCPPPHLGAQLRSRPFSVAETLDVGVRLAGAVESAHNLGVLHRDIKPANILFTEFRNPVLADFGIARAADHDTTIRAFSPAWAPPEQMRGSAATPAVDIYSLCATLWAMLLGRGPFDDSDETLLRTPSPLPDNVPDSLVQLLEDGLAAAPSQRPTSALQLARELQRVQAALGLPVTPVELWDGQGARDHSPTLREADAVDPVPLERTRVDERTHLVALSDDDVEALADTPESHTANAHILDPPTPHAPIPDQYAPGPGAQIVQEQIGADTTRTPGGARWMVPAAVVAVLIAAAALFGVLNLPGTPDPIESPSTSGSQSSSASSTTNSSTSTQTQTGTQAPTEPPATPQDTSGVDGSWNG